MCLFYSKVQSIIHETVEIHVFCCHNCNHKPLMEQAKGQNKRFCCAAVALRMHKFKFKRPSLKYMLLNCCLKFKSARITLRVIQIRVVFYVYTLFVNFTVLSMEFPITNCLLFFFQANGIFYQIILSHVLGRGPNKSSIKKSKCHQRQSFLKALKITIVLIHNFNFNFNKLKDAAKSNHTSETKCLAVF